MICTQRRIYDDEQLRPLSRPICTGPRQEAGYPNWPFPVTRSWTLFSDDIKVMKHGVEAAFGVGAEVFHALNSEGKTAHVTAQVVLRGFQLQGSSEVPFRRHAPPSSDLRRASIPLAN